MSDPAKAGLIGAENSARHVVKESEAGAPRRLPFSEQLREDPHAQLSEGSSRSLTEYSLGEDSHAQLRAIGSIPYYIERSTYFLVVAPRAEHRETGARCDLESWRGRGWCRLEEAANL